MLVHLLVQHPQLPDDLAALVGEQREGDAVGTGKAGQHVHRVVADAKDGDVVPREVGQVPLQFDQLRLAERSPRGTAVKDDQSPPPVAGLVQLDTLAVLIGQDDVREALPNRRATRGAVDATVHGSRHKCSFSPGGVEPTVLLSEMHTEAINASRPRR